MVLWDVSGSIGCPNGGASKKNRLSLINALRVEAKKIAVTEKNKQFLAILDEQEELSLIDDSKPITIDEQGRYVSAED